MDHNARGGVSTNAQCKCQERGQELTHLELERGGFGRMLHGNPSVKIYLWLPTDIFYIENSGIAMSIA